MAVDGFDDTLNLAVVQQDSLADDDVRQNFPRLTGDAGRDHDRAIGCRDRGFAWLVAVVEDQEIPRAEQDGDFHWRQ